MSNTDDGVAVTYTGREAPFVDRIYGTGLTFMPAQTRSLPSGIAAKFLLHKDVFARAAAKDAKKADTTAKAQTPADDTAEQLEAAKKIEDEQREQEESKFLLIEQVKAMDKDGLRAWAKQHLKDPLPGNASLATMQKRVIDQIDQYGVP